MKTSHYEQGQPLSGCQAGFLVGQPAGLPCSTWSATPHAAAPQVTRAWSTFGPQAIGTERFPTASSGSSLAQVAGAILGKQAWVENPDKDEVSSNSGRFG
jgi:hypothetical protein